MSTHRLELREWRSLVLRGVWIAVRVLLIVWLAEAGRAFLYQGF